MGLCLLVYSLGQRALRQAALRAKQTIDNQLGKQSCYSDFTLGISMFHVDSSGDDRALSSKLPILLTSVVAFYSSGVPLAKNIIYSPNRPAECRLQLLKILFINTL